MNNLEGGTYAEVYAGGAGIALGLLASGHAKTAYINDLNPAVYAFWSAVFNTPDDLCELIRSTPLTIKEWKKQRSIFRAPKEHSELELGFSAFYLNRTNRSGILKGGVIGGLKQDGAWKMDVRFNRDGLCQKVQQAAVYAEQVKIYNLDAEDFLKQFGTKLPKDSLLYLDPPYFVKSKGLYQDGYSLEDHERLAKRIAKLRRPWIVSYDDVPEVWTCYGDFRSISYELSYTAGAKGKGKEVLFVSEGIQLPGLKSPLELSTYAGE